MTTSTLGTLASATSSSMDPTLATRSATPAAAGLGGVRGAPRVVLRLEGAAVLAASVAGYAQLGGSWVAFALLFFTVDVSMLGYLVSQRIGAIAYNVGHSYLTPALLAALAIGAGALSSEVAAYPMAGHAHTLLLGALIWIGHIGFDRMAGYGLKYASNFFDTHLGRVGRAPRA